MFGPIILCLLHKIHQLPVDLLKMCLYGIFSTILYFKRRVKNKCSLLQDEGKILEETLTLIFDLKTALTTKC